MHVLETFFVFSEIQQLTTVANPVVHLLQCTKGLYGLSFYLQTYFTLPIQFHALHILVTLFIGIKNFEQIYAEDGSHSANLQGANGIDF